MSVRRLHPDQPAEFVFNQDNLDWARAQIDKYPEGRQASAVIPVLWRAQEQNDGWISEPAIRYVADLLDMPNIRVLEVATFYTMFQLKPVGRKAHVQVCGTTPCMLRGSDDLIRICKSRIADAPHQLSEDGDFSWEEVECLGACVNAPMVQIFKDTYEDLDDSAFTRLLDDIAAGKAVTPGPQNGRRFGAPIDGATTLKDIDDATRGGDPVPTAVAGAMAAIDTVAGASINGGGETRLYQPGQGPDAAEKAPARPSLTKKPKSAAKPAAKTAKKTAKASAKESPASAAGKPAAIDRPATPDDLKLISGVGPKLESVLNGLGIYTFAQVAAWSGEEIAWVDDHLKFKGRIERDNWLDQADALLTGGVDEYVRRFGKKPR